MQHQKLGFLVVFAFAVDRTVDSWVDMAEEHLFVAVHTPASDQQVAAGTDSEEVAVVPYGEASGICFGFAKLGQRKTPDQRGP